MRQNRHWWIAGAVLAVVIVAIAVSQIFFKGTSQECRPVRELLDFNATQAALIKSKATDDSDAPIASYQVWADGLAERAGKVTDTKLAASAVTLADLASQFVAKLPAVQAPTQAGSVMTQAPPEAYQLVALNDQITSQIQALTKECPN
jgi:hypothetical protein